MYSYILIGAAAGILIGSLIPPGHIFWFAIGAASGWLAQRYVNRRHF